MIKTLLFVAKIIIEVIPFVLLCVASGKLNLNKSNRSRQFLMPVIALLYVALCMIFIDPTNSWLMNFINNIPVWLANFASKSWVPNFLYIFLLRLSNGISNLITRINLNFWIFFMEIWKGLMRPGSTGRP